MNVQGVLTFVGLAITVLGLIGGSFALIKGSYNKARIQALREDNDDLRKRLDDCDRDIIKRDAREQTLTARITHIESENELLKTMVTQRANVDEVLERLNVHHQAAMAGQASLVATVTDTQAKLMHSQERLLTTQERLVSMLERTSTNGKQ